MIAWVLSGARLLQLGSTLALLGSPLLFLYGYQPQTARATDDSGRSWDRSLLLWMSIIGVGSAIAWLLAEAVSLTGTWTSWRDVLTGTGLGRVLAMRTGLLALSFAVCVTVRPARALWVAVSLLAAVSVASFAWTGHGSIGGGSTSRLHLYADVLHLLSAAVWIGALLSLSIVLARSLRTSSSTEAERIARALAQFSHIGPLVVSVLLLTGLVNSWFLVGAQHWRALFSSTYGLVLTVKVALFGLMLVLAAMHRYRAVPELQMTIAGGADFAPILRRLQASMSAQTALALLVLAAVAVLGTLEPSAAA